MASLDGMDPAFASALANLMRASGGVIDVKSGYRSVERQAQLYAAAVQKYGSPEKARRYVAPPGKSNHNKGMAADLEFKTPEAKALAHRLAPQFGLVFPMDYEPWHIEPVGARDGADPQAYLVPPEGSLHPQDPTYVRNRPDVMLAQLSDAITAPTRIGGALEVLEGKFPGESGQGQTPPLDENVAGDTMTAGGSGIGGDVVERFMGAVRQHESGGNYKILTGAAKKNPSMTASGAYQVINSTWNNYGGYKRAMDAPPEVQDRFIRERVQGFIASGVTNPRDWAAIWYTGHVPKSAAEWNSQPNKGLSINTYADRIEKAMGG